MKRTTNRFCASFHSPVSPIFMLSPVAAAGSRSEPEGEVLEAQDRPAAKEAIPLPEVPEPSAEEVARHRLTHVPYKRWCRYCAVARMANMARWKRPEVGRITPLPVQPLTHGFCHAVPTEGA